MTRRTLAWTLLFGIVGCSSDEQPAATVHHEAGEPDARPVVHDDAARDAAKEAAKPPPKEGGHEGGGEADAPADVATEAPWTQPYPKFLSETGLYADIAKGTLETGVRPYEVHYPLWSDGAGKKRWVFIPAGKQIDTSDMDFWIYPVGMKAWKEFTVGGKRIETRLQWKSGPNPEDWQMIAYQWLPDGSDAVARPDGVPDASGTTHDIPSQGDCLFCHGNMKDRLLGVNAIQLSHTQPGLTISELITKNQLTNPPSGPFTIPGPSVVSDALGYLHGNCGDCHNRTSNVFVTIDMQLWESTSNLGTVADTNPYRTAVDQPTPGSTSINRVVPGDHAHSLIYLKMSVRGSGQMPPLATEITDPTGLTKIRTWIDSLPKLTDGGTEGGATDGG